MYACVKYLQVLSLWIVKNLYKGMGRGLYCKYSKYMERITITKIIKNGNSLGVNIPKNILLALDIKRGDQVSFGVYSDDVICIRKISQAELSSLIPKQH